MKKFIITFICWVAFCIGVMLLAGCSPVPLMDTKVLDKQYEPATQFVAVMPMVIGNTTIMIPYTIYDDEDYVLNVMGYTKENDRKCRRIYVSKEQYDAVRIGDRVDHLTMQYEDEHKEVRN